MTAPIIYLARHATPAWNMTHLPYDIPPGPPLTEQGEAEATQLGIFLQQAGVQRIYTSPLARCQRTAQLAAQVVGVPVEEEPAVAEWRQGEDVQALRERLLPILEKVSRESATQGPVAIITHGGPIAILLEALGMDGVELNRYRAQFDRNNPLPPAGVWLVTRLSLDQPWQWSLVFTPERNGHRFI